MQGDAVDCALFWWEIKKVEGHVAVRHEIEGGIAREVNSYHGYAVDDSGENIRVVSRAKDDISVIVDDRWQEYWSKRCENLLDDAETLMFDQDHYLTEIGQKTTDLSKVQSQYIGLMWFKEEGLKALLDLSAEAKRRSENGEALWRTGRTYTKIYMTDLLQGLIDEGKKLRAVHIQRGWYKIDDCDDLKVVEAEI